MKRSLDLTIIVTILTMILTGCGASAPEQATPPSTKPGNAEPGQPTLPEQVIYDENDIKITFKSYEYEELELLVENGTDKNIALSADELVINGITVPVFLYVEAAAGKKTVDIVDLDEDIMEVAQIRDIARLHCPEAQIVDTDSYETLHDLSFTLAAQGSEGFRQPIDSTGDRIFERNGVTVTAQTVSGSFFGQSLRLFVRNGMGRDVIVQAENVSVNGSALEAWLYDKVYDGTVRYCELELFEDGLEDSGIGKIEEVSFTISLTDPKTFQTLITSDRITISAKG